MNKGILIINFLCLLFFNCKDKEKLHGEVISLEIHSKKVSTSFDYNHLSICLAVENRSYDTIYFSPQEELNKYTIPSYVEWHVNDSTFYLFNEDLSRTVPKLVPHQRDTLCFRTKFVAKGNTFIDIYNNYKDYINSEYNLLIKTNDGEKIFSKQDSVNLFYILGDNRIDPFDTLSMIINITPTLNDVKLLREKLDSIKLNTPDNEIDIDTAFLK